MGAKNLKAVAVYGTKEVPVAYPARLEKLLIMLAPSLVQNSQARSRFGTAGALWEQRQLVIFR